MKGKAAWFLVGFGAALLVGFIAWSVFPSHEKQMRRLTDELTTSLPRKIEAKTTQTSCLSISGENIIFVYSLQNYTIGELAPDEVHGMRASLTETLINYVPKGFTFHYICMDKDGAVLFEIDMPPPMYK
jgi:hypothetical protein